MVICGLFYLRFCIYVIENWPFSGTCPLIYYHLRPVYNWSNFLKRKNCIKPVSNSFVYYWFYFFCLLLFLSFFLSGLSLTLSLALTMFMYFSYASVTHNNIYPIFKDNRNIAGGFNSFTTPLRIPPPLGSMSCATCVKRSRSPTWRRCSPPCTGSSSPLFQVQRQMNERTDRRQSSCNSKSSLFFNSFFVSCSVIRERKDLWGTGKKGTRRNNRVQSSQWHVPEKTTWFVQNREKEIPSLKRFRKHFC